MSGFWLIFCISLSIAAGLLIILMRRIQSLSEAEQINRLERIK